MSFFISNQLYFVYENCVHDLFIIYMIYSKHALIVAMIDLMVDQFELNTFKVSLN